MTMHDMTYNGARCALKRYYAILVKGESSEEVFLVLGIFEQIKWRGTAACSLCQGRVADEWTVY